MALPYHRVNNADDSTGKTWGFEGNNVFILLGAILLGISILSEGMSKGWYPVTVCVTGAAPVVIGSVWVFGFRQGKPPHYDLDLLDTKLNGTAWSANWNAQPEPFWRHATDCPNGFFRNGLLIYGQGLDPFVPQWVSQGFPGRVPRPGQCLGSIQHRLPWPGSPAASHAGRPISDAALLVSRFQLPGGAD